jgi:hypothetical protein
MIVLCSILAQNMLHRWAVNWLNRELVKIIINFYLLLQMYEVYALSFSES